MKFCFVYRSPEKKHIRKQSEKEAKNRKQKKTYAMPYCDFMNQGQTVEGINNFSIV